MKKQIISLVWVRKHIKIQLEQEDNNNFDVFIHNAQDSSYGGYNRLDMAILQISDSSEVISLIYQNEPTIQKQSDHIMNFQDCLHFTRSILSINSSEIQELEKQLTIKHVIASLKFSDNRFFGLFSNNIVPQCLINTTVQQENDINFNAIKEPINMIKDIDQLSSISELSWSEIQSNLNSMLHTIDSPLSFVKLHEIIQNLTKVQISKQLLFAHVVQLSQRMNLHLLNEFEQKQDFTIIIKG